MMSLRSKLRRDLLAYYFTNPGATHYLRELAGLLAADPANLSREMTSLERQGIFLSQTRGRQKYFRLNRAHSLFNEYRRIIFKTAGVAGQLRNTLSGVAGVRRAHLYGSFARDQTDSLSDIDVLIVGEPNAEALEKVIGKLEKRLRREINYTVMDPREFQVRRDKKDPFLEAVSKDQVELLPVHEET